MNMIIWLASAAEINNHSPNWGWDRRSKMAGGLPLPLPCCPMPISVLTTPKTRPIIIKEVNSEFISQTGWLLCPSFIMMMMMMMVMMTRLKIWLLVFLHVDRTVVVHFTDSFLIRWDAEWGMIWVSQSQYGIMTRENPTPLPTTSPPIRFSFSQSHIAYCFLVMLSRAATSLSLISAPASITASGPIIQDSTFAPSLIVT